MDHVISNVHNGKTSELLSAEIRAYKIVIESRGDGTVVLLARRLMAYLHDELKISTHELFVSNGKKDRLMTRTDFMKLMVELEVPFTRQEVLQIIELLDPADTGEITLHQLISFHRTSSDKIILSTSIIMFIVYPTIARNIFKLFSCRTNLSTDENVLHLTADLGLTCYNGIHLTYVTLVGIPGTMLYIIGFPLVSIFAMFQGGRGKNDVDAWNDRALYRYSMFLNGYRTSTFYWECIIATRKSFITFIGVFFSAYGIDVQSYIGLIVLFGFIMSHVYVQPFVNTTLNTLETMALTVSFLTLYLGLMFYQGWLKEDWQKTGLSMLIVISNVIFMFCAAKMIFKEFIEDKIGINKPKNRKNAWTKITPSEDDGNGVQRARRGRSNSAFAALENSSGTKQQARKERSNSVDIIAERAWTNSDGGTEGSKETHHYNL